MRHPIGRAVLALALAAAPVVGTGARADDWDAGTDHDGSATTDNVVAHGAEQVHDLAQQATGPDRDFYLVTSRAFSSYEMVFDGLTGDLGLDFDSVQRLNATGGLVLQNADNVAGNWSVRWQQGSGPSVHLVRMGNNACDGVCQATDTYRVRFYDTTYTVPRFNNSATQSTVLFVQNTVAAPCAVTQHYFSPSGGLIASSGPETINPRTSLVTDTAAIVPGVSGSIRVTHDCGYGNLSGKAVSVEPSTGFAFDTAMAARPR
jgi:hypothetical protein